MLKKLPRIATIALVAMLAATTSGAQETDTTRPVSVDPELLAMQNARIPKEYTIGTLNVTGVNYLDTGIVVSISGLQSGDKLMIPGTDAFSKAISNLWRQRLFSNVQIYITALRGDVIDVEIAVQERPKLGSFKFQGVKKTEAEELEKKAALVRSTIITENTRRNAVETIKKYYIEKGFQNVQVEIQEKPDPSIPNASNLTFVIDKGKKVRVNEVNFYGNTQVPDLKLKRQMKGTKERSHFTLYPTKTPSPYGTNDPITFKEYINDLGFLSATKTRNFLDPYFRFKLFSSAKFDPKKYEEDKEKILSEYNSLGFRDAQILDDTMYYTPDGHLNIDLKMAEGSRYYFGNITWKGNTKYADSILNNILGIQKGDVYNLQTLNQRLGKQLTPEGGDISGLYMDDGYLFFQANPIETSVYNDTIDHEIRIIEGPQATIRNVAIFGNEKTKDHVIRRELRTIPGEKFSRSDLIRSQRELAALNYFNQETINPGVVPNQEDGTVDINWKLEEKSSDQLELSAGWGGGIGLTGTLGVTFNNFSIKNIFNKQSWDPLPTGDGQKLSLRLQSNGRAYRSYNFSFTEPWLGGRKRNPFTISFYNTKYSNAYNFATGRLEKSRADSSFLRITGATVSLGKQLKWPDDYFSIMYSLSYTQYQLKNYSGIFRGDDGNYLNNITSNNVSFKVALQRSSVFDPTFPRSGSNFLASVQMTPPYSLLNDNFSKNNGQYKTPEYHKWRFNAEWFVPIGKPMGADKNRQFVLKLAAKYGFMGRYNKNVAYSPFERYQLGGDGLTNQFGFLGYDVIALRGYPVFENSDPSVNPDLSQSTRQFTIFNKYQLELRYPLVTQPSSTIYGLAFFDAANGWFNFKEYNPFRLRRSVGVGMRFFLPMFGLLGFDYGVGLDRFQPGQTGLKGVTKFTFMLGFEPE
jgi:outer membrane protein insertion porin family